MKKIYLSLGFAAILSLSSLAISSSTGKDSSLARAIPIEEEEVEEEEAGIMIEIPESQEVILTLDIHYPENHYPEPVFFTRETVGSAPVLLYTPR